MRDSSNACAFLELGLGGRDGQHWYQWPGQFMGMVGLRGNLMNPGSENVT